MGNSKNRRKNSSNNHRYAYRKKKLPWQDKRRAKVKDTQKQTVSLGSRTVNSEGSRTVNSEGSQTVSLGGSRIVNVDLLQQYTDDLNKHAAQCQGQVILSGEVRDGLVSIISGKCSTCNHTIKLQTSKKVKGPRGYNRWECNLAAVWGQMSTGGGHSQLEETMSVVGVPVMTSASFVRTERDIGEVWKRELQESMAEAGREEKRLAELRNAYHEGVPAITVIVDGGWSKRSHKHSYNANSGVALIIGAATRKILYIGVKNKYCAACARNISCDKHKCYRNWTESSSEMEPDIILEGFLECERVHGVRYTQFIGDGDSSVHSTLLQSVPGWGHAIKKLECANHTCKCYRGALERLVQDNPSYKGNGGLTLKMRKRLVSAARCAIRMRSKETDQKQALASLKHDLQNGPLHCFGFHQQCSRDFCTTAQKQATSGVSSPPSTSGIPTSVPHTAASATSPTSAHSTMDPLTSSSSVSPSATSVSSALAPPSTLSSVPTSASLDLDADDDEADDLTVDDDEADDLTG